MAEPAAELQGIVKRFARVVANDHASFDVSPGEIHALVGENGAGKSTLMRVLYGEIAPDAGEIQVEGRPTRFRSPRDALAAGIGMVHQHFMLVDTLTVTENAFLGMEPTRGGLLDGETARRRLLELASRYHLEVDPDARVAELGVGEEQRVEILKVLLRGVRTLILDEPTAVLTPQECQGLFRVLESLRDQGTAVVLITHRLEEVREVADRVTVMRAGRTVSTHPVAEVSVRELAGLMIGRELDREAPTRRPAPGRPVLSLGGISARGDAGRTVLHDVSLQVRRGEILGVAGVEGNGQTELMEVAAGLRRPLAGEILLEDTDLTGGGRREFLARGVSFVPEDRRDRGLIGEFSVGENLILGRHRSPRVGRGPFLEPSRVRALARPAIAANDIRPPDPGRLARTLSGGNQQKVIMARELRTVPSLLVASQPTRGVDVGATSAIHARIEEVALAGAAVLVASAELAELLRLCDTIVVIYRGRIVHGTAVADTDPETLGRWMLGGAEVTA